MMYTRLAVLCAAALIASDAFATMTPLTDMPSGKSVEACHQWATGQDEDNIDIWGMQDSGMNSQAVAVDRLARFCIDGSKPEIVGFGSSVGFDGIYCRKHSSATICRNRR